MRLRVLILAMFVGLATLSSMAAAAQESSDAQVKRMATTLRLRAEPSVDAAVLAELAAATSLRVLARTANNNWLQVETADATVGWVAAGYVELFVSLDSIPVSNPALSSAPAPTSAPVDAAVPAASSVAGAHVMAMSATLRLRSAPSTAGEILAEMMPGTPLTINGRSSDGAWLDVTTTDGLRGWAAAAYIVTGGAPVAVTAPAEDGMTTPAGSVRGVRAIVARGQALGNQRHVFTTIGDSMTASAESLDAIGRGLYTLGGFAGLQRVIDTYMTAAFNSFTHDSAAAGAGWTTMTALDPQFRNPAVCPAEVSSVECEINRVKPAVALIQLGTNDLQYLSVDQFAYNIGRIVDLCIEKGVVPVLATIPYRDGFGASVDAFNATIRGVAASRDIPLWDVKGALDGLPNRGISGDGIHPSSAPGGYADSANFASAEALQAGYVTRNLTALQALDRLLAAMGG